MLALLTLRTLSLLSLTVVPHLPLLTHLALLTLLATHLATLGEISHLADAGTVVVCNGRADCGASTKGAGEECHTSS